MQQAIKTLSDGSELVPYNSADYPVYAGCAKLTSRASANLAYHWHDDMEFGLVTKGAMSYFINGETTVVREGRGIFINARQMHGNSPIEGEDCEYRCVLVHPQFILGKYASADAAINALTHNEAWSYQPLSKDVAWQSELIKIVRVLYEAILSRSPSSILEVLAHSFKAAGVLAQNMPDEPNRVPPADRRIPALRNMVGYIQMRYAEKISVTDICRAGNVGTSTCYGLFGKHFNMTPLGYLTLYRLNKAADRLKNRNLSVTEVAYSTGFSSASYFCECFRRQFSQSPTQYREKRDV